MKDKKIAVLMGGLSAERDVSLKSGLAVHQALLRMGYDSTAIDVRNELASMLREEKIEVAGRRHRGEPEWQTARPVHRSVPGQKYTPSCCGKTPS